MTCACTTTADLLRRLALIGIAAGFVGACTPSRDNAPRIDLQPAQIAERSEAEVEAVALDIPDNSCGRAIRSFADLLARDLEAGMVARRVHDAAMADLAVANNACRAGAQDQALSALRATRVRHGYPAG
jgi:hypothetical protein